MKYVAWLFVISCLLCIQCKTSKVIVKTSVEPCIKDCDLAGDEGVNTNENFSHMGDSAMVDSLMLCPLILFPLRIGIIQPVGGPNVNQETVLKTIDNLNEAFLGAPIQFEIGEIEIINSDLRISDLTEKAYQPYKDFSDQYDKKDMISVYFFPFDPEFCKETGNSISCGRQGGFSFILSERTNNVVLSQFDLSDYKIIAHEMGHFFGLYHTFESNMFGPEKANGSDCSTTGDRICDTPADVEALYEIYVNYSTCQMIGYSDPEGTLYKPDITNFMAYYKPCYLKKFRFSPNQLEVMTMAAHSPLRRRFSTL